MCGICGKINLNSEPVSELLIRSMTRILSHRGPDGEGLYVNGKVGLGHRRLKVIDLSDSARQPMSNEDGTIWIVYNGEIYNFLELRKGLEGKGHVFRSKSDVEVIIHLYEEKGLDCVKDLRGMFAFAIWDDKRKRLFLARDRVGKKPLNYAINARSFIFASEIKSILQDPSFTQEIDPDAVDLYLTYQCIPSPQTIFKEIKKLPPAHTLVLENGQIRIDSYWSLSYQNPLRMKEQDYCQNIRDLLNESCKIRMISDVPLGVFLSGGIDSSAVTSIISRISTRPVKTFSLGFEEESFNELKYARKIAKEFNTEHHEYIVKPDVLDILPKLVWHFSEPFADASAIPTYYISKMSRQAVTVALNGDGGDESFAGYERYAAAKIANLYGLLPLFLRKGFYAIFENFGESTRKKDFLKNLKRFLYGATLSAQKRYAYWMTTFDDRLKSKLYTDDFKNRLNNNSSWGIIEDNFKRAKTEDFLSSLFAVDVGTYLPNDLLVKADIATMANSLEGRSPFLDHKLMEFAARIPSGLKLKGLTNKYILKKALAGLIPSEILRRKKYGFGIPIGSWFRRELKDSIHQVLLSPNFLKRNYFNESTLRALVDEHVSGRADHGYRIWALMNLELWHSIFIDNKKTNVS